MRRIVPCTVALSIGLGSIALGCSPAEVTCTLDDPPGEPTSTRVFWLTGLEVPIDRGDGVPGLDLDGTISDGSIEGCPGMFPDATSSLGDGEGVDNALAELTNAIETNWDPPTTTDRELSGAMREGAIPLAIVLEEDGADSCGNAAVTIRLRRMARTDGAPIAIGDGGLPIAGQPLALGEELATGRGAIEDGRVRASLSGIGALPIDREAVRAPLGALGVMEPVAIAFDVEGRWLLRGVLAGSWDVEALVPELDAALEHGTESDVRSLLGALADLGPVAEGGQCSRLSAGLAIRAEEIAIE